MRGTWNRLKWDAADGISATVHREAGLVAAAVARVKGGDEKVQNCRWEMSDKIFITKTMNPDF